MTVHSDSQTKVVMGAQTVFIPRAIITCHRPGPRWSQHPGRTDRGSPGIRSGAPAGERFPLRQRKRAYRHTPDGRWDSASILLQPSPASLLGSCRRLPSPTYGVCGHDIGPGIRLFGPSLIPAWIPMGAGCLPSASLAGIGCLSGALSVVLSAAARARTSEGRSAAPFLRATHIAACCSSPRWSSPTCGSTV